MLLRDGQAAEALAVPDGAGPGLVGGHRRQTQGLHFLRDGQRVRLGRTPPELHLGSDRRAEFRFEPKIRHRWKEAEIA